MSSSIIIALCMVAIAALWMASGILVEDNGKAHEPDPITVQQVLVRSSGFIAQPAETFLRAYGVVEAQHRLIVRAETAGRVVRIAVRQGERVQEGQLLFQLSLEARRSQLENAIAQFKKLQLDLSNARRLERGSPPSTRPRARGTDCDGAGDGRPNSRGNQGYFRSRSDRRHSVDPDEFVSVGDELAVLIDNDPVKVEVRVPQQSVQSIEHGAPASVTFATGRDARGRICFVSAEADEDTRTLAVEILVANPDHRVPSRTSAEARLPTGTVKAHKIPPAILALDENGNLGVKVVREGTVEFHQVEIVKSQRDAVWVTGLPEQVNLITAGQGFVRDGDRVRVTDDSALSNARPARNRGDADMVRSPDAGRALPSCAERWTDEQLSSKQPQSTNGEAGR